MRWCAAFLALLLTLLSSRDAAAQMIGIANMLNPEGSRLFPQSFTVPRHPGKPDPRWRSFEWRFVDLAQGPSRFRLYFYEEELEAARFAIPRIRRQMEELSGVFHFWPKRDFSYLLFSSHREFQQANIFFVAEGVQGITSTEEATMAIPYWGEARTFDHISKHELVHQFQVQKMGEMADTLAIEVLAGVPLWFIEGMAEYYSLGGVEPETRGFIRDVLVHPDERTGHTMPKFLEDGQLDFVHVYKIGQAKIHFLETTYGAGTAQRLYEAAGGRLRAPYRGWLQLVTGELARPSETIEREWQAYLEREYRADADRRTQALDDLQPLEDAGETLDHFTVSPDGSWLALREIDPLLGRTSVRLMNLKAAGKRGKTVAVDQDPNLLTLFFFQLPILALADDQIAFVVGTAAGPEIELRRFRRGEDGEIEIGGVTRIRIHRRGINQASSPAFSPDGKRLAFVGVDPSGRQSVYVLDGYGEWGRGSVPMRRLTRDVYSWRAIAWTPAGIVVASDRTPSGGYGLVRLDPDGAWTETLPVTPGDLRAPDAAGGEGAVVFPSATSGSEQVHRFFAGKETRLTDVKTSVREAALRDGTLYALTLRSGRFRLFRVPEDRLLAIPVARSSAPADAVPWRAGLEPLEPDQVRRYRPFVSSGMRVDGLTAFFGSGSVGGVAAAFSDLMRNYSLEGEIAVLGSAKYTTATGFYSSREGRSAWTLGAYHISQPRLDTIYLSDFVSRTYLYREWGVLGAYQYPLTMFTYVDAELRVAGAARSDYSDPFLAPSWEAQNPGNELLLAPIFRLGYDRILYELYTGPIQGFGILLESETSWFPRRKGTTERMRLDIAQYFRLFGRTVVALQGLAGAAWGGNFRNPFFLSSDDILRGYVFADDRLFGNYAVAGKAELRFPIGSLFGFPPLRGLAAYDIGTVYKQPGEWSRSVSSSYTFGIGLNVPPIAFNIMSSYATRSAPGPVDRPVVHFTLRYLYL
jgi:hypothetical protein